MRGPGSERRVMPMTLDPGQTACDEAARSMKEADAAKCGHNTEHIGPGLRKSRYCPKRKPPDGSAVAEP